MGRLAVATICLLFLGGGCACATTYPPPPDGPVLDQAALIPDAAEQSLDAELRRYFLRTCRALVVVTVPSLRGETVDDYARHLANTWKVGGPVRGDGVLLLVAPKEREVRLEVSRSLEIAMPDEAAAAIIQGGMLDRYREGDFVGGISQAVDQIVAQLDKTAPPVVGCRNGAVAAP